ncbi:thioredoxin domain-containing protein [Niameybacter sp.]|uniref:thioredoxin domain-containing protein n=1 Tax=Niameybacter sp. TaxID=2033640 RepID=UPI002FCA79CB
MIKEITSFEEFNELAKEGKVLVDVYSKTCGPCKMLGFVLADLEKDLPESAILKIDFDQNKEIVEKYDVASYPTILLLENGEEVQRLKGLQQKPALKKLLEA